MNKRCLTLGSIIPLLLIPASLAHAQKATLKTSTPVPAATPTIDKSPDQIETKYVKALDDLEKATKALQVEVDAGNKQIKANNADYKVLADRFLAQRAQAKAAYQAYVAIRSDYQKYYDGTLLDFAAASNQAFNAKNSNDPKPYKNLDAAQVVYMRANKNAKRAVLIRDLWGEVASDALDYFIAISPQATNTNSLPASKGYFKTRSNQSP